MYLCSADRLIAVPFSGGRKVRTPKSSIAGNARLLSLVARRTSATERMYSSAVVKSGKLYAVQCHVYRQLRVTRPLSGGRQMDLVSNNRTR